MTSPPQRIADYQVVRELGRGASGAVYHVERGGRAFALKVIDSTDEASPLRVRREAAALARVDHPNLAKVHEVGRYGDRSYIVMELVVGENLVRTVKRGVLDEQLVRRIAKRIASALAAVHRHRLVHRDVKPDNIVVDDSNEPKLIDFGLVRALDTSDTQDEFAGTLKYASPEHVGMIKRGIDGRSDLYSLGCVLFYCIAGRAPFEDGSALELIRKHAYVIPTPLEKLRGDISPVMAAIVAKLLAKNPDERYQSAEGLLYDLERLDTLNAVAAAGQPVELGTLDVGSTYDAPLIGRDEELTTLKRTWQRLSEQGRGAVLLLEGEAGSGKTRLVREWLRHLGAPLLLSGKCQQADKVPFGPIREALDEHLTPLLRRGANERTAVAERVRRAAGDFAPFIKRLSPTLTALFDIDAAHDADEADRERFYAAVAHFLAGLAREHASLVFHLDDIQWLDDASLQVLIRLKDLLASTKLVVVAASRSDLASTRARDRFVTAMSDALIAHLELRPLDAEAITKLVAVHLGGPRPNEALVERVAARCRGNPFVLAQYIGALLEGGALQPTTSGWEIDSARLADLALPDDVLELIISRLAGLSQESIGILEHAAIMGSPFAADLLARVTDSYPEVVLSALGDAQHVGLVESTTRDTYSFTHDRIEEALRHRLSPEAQRDLHHRVALTLDALGDLAPGGARALARHYALGHGERCPDRLYQTCFAAGLVVLDAFGSEEGLDLLKRAHETVDRAGLTIPDRERLALTEALGRAHMYLGNHAEAIEYFHHALGLQAATAIDRARLHEHLAQLHSEQSHHEQDFHHVLAGLSELGEPLPQSDVEVKASILWNTRMIALMRQHELGYGAAKGEELRGRKILARLYKHGIYSSTYAGRWDESYLLQARALINAHLLGDRRESIEALATYGSVLAERRYSTARDCFERAFRIAEQQGDPRALAYARLYWAPMHSKLGDIRRGTEISAENFARFIGWLGAFDQIMWAHMAAYDLVCQGKARDAIDCIRWGLEKQRTTMGASENARLLVAVHLPACFAMLGDLREAQNRLAELTVTFESQGVGSECALLELAVVGTTLFVLRETGEHGPPMRDALRRYKELALPARRLPYHFRHHALSAAYARLELYKAAPAEVERHAMRDELRAALDDAKVGCAQPVFLAHLHCISAAMARIAGDFGEAEQLLARARADAERTDNAWAMLEIATEAGNLARAQADDVGARRELEVAREIVTKSGFRHRAKQLAIDVPAGDTQHELVFSPTSAASSYSAISARRLDAILRISAACSSTLDSEHLIRAALDEVLKVIDAERAVLFRIAADSTPEFWAGRDCNGVELGKRSDYRSAAIEKVAQTRTSLSLQGGREDGNPHGSESTEPHEVRSVIASPVISQGELLGIIYADVPLAIRMFSSEELGTLGAMADQLAISITSARNILAEVERRERERAAQLTSMMHSLFSPRPPHAAVAGIELAGIYASNESCGDWWWYGAGDDGSVSVFVGNIRGRGAERAMLTAALATVVRLLMRPQVTVPELLGRLHHSLIELGGGHQAAMAALKVNAVTREIELWSAGAPPAVVVGPSGACELVSTRGSNLGCGELALGHIRRSLQHGERLFLVADGTDDRRLGRHRLIHLMHSTLDLRVQPALQSMLDELAQGSEPIDALVLVAVELAGAATGSR